MGITPRRRSTRLQLLLISKDTGSTPAMDSILQRLMGSKHIRDMEDTGTSGCVVSKEKYSKLVLACSDFFVDDIHSDSENSVDSSCPHLLQWHISI
jgi:hypothetical protein